MFNIPVQVKNALDLLHKSGYEAYIVGGCVRDFILGHTPNDYDITTNALPLQTEEVFKNFHIIETGIKHGTVTVMFDHMPLEITTFRIDGEYADNRHPLSVLYTSRLNDDLARRDFTMNAIAYNHEDGFGDPFNGKEAIESKIIVCVGNPDERFNEDALRIMRCIRFSSQLGFSIEKNTSDSVFKLRQLLKNISVERIQVELDKLVMGKNVYEVLMKYSSVLEVFIPEIFHSVDFEQKSEYHIYTVWEHTAVAVANSCNDRIVRLALLFHDIGKPFSYQEDGDHLHFKNHAEVSAEMAEKILKRLKYDNFTINRVVTLIAHHSDTLDTNRAIKRELSRIGAEAFFQLIEVKKGDNMAKKEFCKERIPKLENIKKIAQNFIEAQSCLAVSELKVNGNDMKELGYKGKEIGDILNLMLENVIDEKLENNFNDLIEFAKTRNI